MAGDSAMPASMANSDGRRNRQHVSESQRNHGPPHGAPFAFLHPERHRKEPTHPGIEAVKGPQSRQV